MSTGVAVVVVLHPAEAFSNQGGAVGLFEGQPVLLVTLILTVVPRLDAHTHAHQGLTSVAARCFIKA